MSYNKNKPAVLFPLRLEIYDHMEKGYIIRPHKPPLDRPDIIINRPGTVINTPQGPLAGKDIKIPFYRQEIWIRWYPDDCQIFPGVSGITRDEEIAYEIYLKSISNVTDQEIIKQTWASFVRKVGAARARYIADIDHNKLGDKDEALKQFISVGSKLKLLPRTVKLFTFHEKGASFDEKFRFLAEGNPIPEDLVISDPDHPYARWMVDFEEAVAKGMGLKIAGTAKCRQVGDADWLIAVGLKDSADNDAVLEELLIRYKATGRFDILQQDTPTNNTENGKTGFTGIENELSGTDEVMDHNLPQNRAITGGQILAGALGITEAIFTGISNAALTEQRSAMAMASVLWDPFTRGYRDMYMHYQGVHDVVSFRSHPVKWRYLSEHFKKSVLGRGLVPAVRIGQNPYGILPVTCLNEWKSSEEKDKEKIILEEGMARVCAIFKERFMGLALEKDDPPSEYDRLVKTLQLNAVPHRIDLQHVSRHHYSPRFHDHLSTVTCPVAAENDCTKALSYFDSIAKTDYADGPGTSSEVITKLRKEISSQPDSVSLLLRMLQYSAIILENNIIEVINDPKLAKEEKMVAFEGYKAMALKALDELKLLSDLPVASLATLLKEVMDCLSCRLDAWINSLANIRLTELSLDDETITRNPMLACGQSGSKNIVGVYGWLEKPSHMVSAHQTDGYFQAPCLNQAISGAILRNAALSNDPNNNSTFQINLSSSRVKKAVWFTEGLQKGYRPGELLGYQVERKLHDKNLDRYLLPLRKIYRFTGQNPGDTPGNANLINGEKFIAAADPVSDLNIELNKEGKPNVTRAEGDKLKAIQSEVSQIRDAVSDLFIAETVYQSVKGNSARAAAWLDVIEGNNTPPRLEVMDTIRSGHPQAQKLMYPLTIKLEDIDEKKIAKPRFMAEPLVAEFCSRELRQDFNYCTVYAGIKLREARDDDSKSVTLAIKPKDDLQMEAIDLVVGGIPELEARARFYIWNQIAAGDSRWSFLGDDFCKSPSYKEFEQRAFITFDYAYDVHALVLMERLPYVRLFLRSAQPLAPEYIGTAVHRDSNDIISHRLDTCILLEQRLTGLLEVYDQCRGNLEYTAELLSSNDDNDPGVMVVLKDMLMYISGLGFKEALLPLPPGSSREANDEIISGLHYLAEKLAGREKEIAVLKANEVLIEHPGKEPIAVQINLDTKSLMKKVITPQGIKWLPLQHEEGAIKLAAVTLYMKNITQAIQKAVGGESMPVYPPFVVKGGVKIAPDRPDYKAVPVRDMLVKYRGVRKNLWVAAKAFPRKLLDSDEIKLYSNEGIHLSLEEARYQALARALPLQNSSIKRWDLFMEKLKQASQTGASPEAARVWSLLDEGCRKMVLSYTGFIRISNVTQQSIIDALNVILGTRDFYAAKYFKNIKLDSDAMMLIKNGIAQLSLNNLMWFNHHLLERIFPGLIEKQISLMEIRQLSIPTQRFTDLHYILPSEGFYVDDGCIITGFLIDEWTDFIPAGSEATAVSFKYETPKAQAPQAILIAVTPRVDPQGLEQWKNEDIAGIIGETIDLMRIRSVSNEKMAGSSLGYFLPALLYHSSFKIPNQSYEQFNGVIDGNFHYLPKN